MAEKYHFGFFGLSGSGKTCILAALDMQRVAHPAGYTGSLLPVKVKRPTGDPEVWNANEKEADILYKSSDRLEDAKQQLKQGSVPEGTELSIDFIFDYKFSSPNTGEFHARLIDYGGELVNPHNAPQEIAKELRDKLEGMDGLIVLAPAPFPNETKGEKLHRLQKTMGLLQFPKPIPIVLLITKWDRLTPLSEHSVVQQPLMEKDLPTTEHHDLYNVLINKVGEENCKAFSVSAFGECKHDTTPTSKGTECPKVVNPLMPYGLLEGFIWLAQRLETVQFQKNVDQLQTYEQVIARYKKWLPYPSLSLWKLKRQGKEITGKFPDNLEMMQRATQARHQCINVWRSRLMVFLPLIVVIPLVMLSGKQAYEDKIRYDYVHRTLNHPNVELNDIKKAEQWLENYYYTTPLAHPFSWLFVISNQQAKSELEQSRRRIEQRFWQAIQKAPSIEKKLVAAKTYIKTFSNGRRVGEAKTIVAKTEETLRQQHEQQWWQPVEQASSIVAKLEAARAYLKALPDGQHSADSHRMIAQIEEELREKEEQQLWLPVEQADSRHVKLEAAYTYQKNLPDGKHKAEINQIITQIEDALRKETEQRLWQPVLSATSPRLQKAAAQTYLQEKPQGKYAAEAKLLIAQAEEVLREEAKILREEKEERLWLQVEQANPLNVKEKVARDYLVEMPEGKHATEAKRIIAEYESQQNVVFKEKYHELFDEGMFLKAVQHLSQRQPKDDQFQILKQQFLTHVFQSLETLINQFIKHRHWQDAYEKLNNYGNWTAEFQSLQSRGKIRALRKKVQEAEDRYLYLAFFQARDVERADNYLRYAPLRTREAEVKTYKQYLIDIQNPLELTLILASIEWGNLNQDDNTITVTMAGENLIEATGINAEANISTGEIGRRQFTRKVKLNESVTIKVKIVAHTWLSGYEINGQGEFKGQVVDLNGKTIELPLPGREYEVELINKAVFRIEGIPHEPILPDWGE